MSLNSMEKATQSDVRDIAYLLVGGGIASLSAAVFLVRDVGVRGADIRVFEQSDRIGGSLDGSGGPDTGYLVRGGRMFERHFACTFDMLASIPSIDTEGWSLKDDIDAFNHEVRNSSRCRLVRGGKKTGASGFGLRARDLLNMARLLMRSERSLRKRRIEECFASRFFASDFWYMWSTTFAFQPWHDAVEFRRYLRRFVHLFPGFARLEGILRTPFNQFDSLVAPIQRWLKERGVQFETGVQVTDVEMARVDGKRCISALCLDRNGRSERLAILPSDRVFLTLGSMTECSTVGSNHAPPPEPPAANGAWALWSRLAARDPAFGHPEAFCNDIEHSKWESFSVTLGDSGFFDFMEKFTGNEAGTGGLVTFVDSNWLMSIVLFHQPHFRNQAKQSFVFWGYGLRPAQAGDFVRKPMAACSGDEILQELAGHLGLGQRSESLLGRAKVIPCMMPFITSQFMPRNPGDRPQIHPHDAVNFAVIGQFCEMPLDVVFTVEYSVRSAMTAVHALTGKGRAPPPVHRADRDLIALIRAARTLLKG